MRLRRLLLPLLTGGLVLPALAQPNLPPMYSFGTLPNIRIHTSNAQMVSDFADLFFALETGERLSHFSRFEGVVGVYVDPNASQVLRRDAQNLVHLIRKKAGVKLSLSDDPKADIIVKLLAQSEISARAQGASCFVQPGHPQMGKTFTPLVSWSDVKTRSAATIYLPADGAPQLQRDCLHEELAQALGPLNDVYHAQGSVFNDDNINGILSDYDLLMLRVAYDANLTSGMDRRATMRRVVQLFDHLNPSGKTASRPRQYPSRRTWAAATARILQHGADATQIASYLSISKFGDGRDGLAYLLAARQTSHAPQDRIALLNQALEAFAPFPETTLYQANAHQDLAFAHLLSHNIQKAVYHSEKAHDLAISHHDAAVLANALMTRAIVKYKEGNIDQARKTRLDSIGWARYAFGDRAALKRWLTAMDAIMQKVDET